MTPTDCVPPQASVFEHLAYQRTVLLTTYKRDGTAVGTPVHIAVDGSVAYIRTFDPSGKLKRLRNNPDAEIAPSTVRGRVTGPPLRVCGRVLNGNESAHAAEALARKYPLLHGKLIPWYHRRKGLGTTQIELTTA